MCIVQIGLLLNFVGAVLLGLSSQFGIIGGGWFNGSIHLKNRIWKCFNILGWLLLAIGFLIQLWK